MSPVSDPIPAIPSWRPPASPSSPPASPVAGPDPAAPLDVLLPRDDTRASAPEPGHLADTRPAPAPASPDERDWQLIVVKVAGHGLAEEIREGLTNLDRAGTSPAAWITVRAEQDERLTDYTVAEASSSSSSAASHLQAEPAGLSMVPARTVPILGEKALHDFLVRAMGQYPSRHVLVAFEGHSHEMRVHMDAIHGALESATRDAGRKLDIVAFDACFLAQAEAASEFQDVARILVGSEEAMEGYRPLEKAAAALATQPMEPHDLARWLVGESTEYTLSAVDLEKFPQVEAGVARVGAELQKIDDPTLLAEVRREIHGAQHFYTNGVRSASPFRNAVDVVDAMQRMLRNPRLQAAAPELLAAGEALARILEVQPDGVVFAEKHVDTVSRSGLELFDVRRAHGLSFYAPITPARLRDEYISFGNRHFEHATGWNEAVAHLTDVSSAGYLVTSTGAWLGGGGLALASAFFSSVQEKVHR